MQDGGADDLEPDDDVEDVLEEAKEAFKLAQEHEEDNRKAFLEDVEFARLGKQWPEEVLKERKLSNRPALTFNLLPPFIRQVINDARQNKPAIKVHPADDTADPETAKIINGLIRNIEYASDADIAYDWAFENAVTGGFGYFRINLDYTADDSFQQDIVIQAIPNPLSVWADPFSTKADSSDWNTAFITESMSRDRFKTKYKGARKVNWNADGYDALKEPWGDKETVQVAEYWKRDEIVTQIIALSDGSVVEVQAYEASKLMYDMGQITPVGSPRPVKSHKVTSYLLTGAEVLETTPWAGRFIPVIPVYGDEVNVEGVRHFRSMIRDGKDAQRSYNYHRTLEAELQGLASRVPWIGRKGTFNTDQAKWETANTVSHAYIEFDGPEPPQRQPFAGVASGAVEAAQNAQNDVKGTLGLFDASRGAPSNEQSGRAILARQREGDVSTFHFVDNLSRSIRHAGRVIVDLIPHVFDGERIARIMGPDGIPQTVPLNQPHQAPQMGPDGRPVMGPQMQPAMGPNGPVVGPDGQPQMQPMLGPDGQPTLAPQLVSKLYDVRVGKYDVTVETGPSFTTKREEAANQMVLVMQADPTLAPVIAPRLAKNLDWEGADEIAADIQQLQQQQQQAGQAKGQPQQDPQAMVQAKMAEIQQTAQLKQAEMQQDVQVRQQQLQQEAQLSTAKMQQEMQLANQRMQQEFAMKQQLAQQEMQLKREQMMQEAQLEREGLQMSAQVKATEAANRVDQTVRMPQTVMGGRMG